MVPTAQGKLPKISHQPQAQARPRVLKSKDRAFGNFAKTQGIWFAQGVNPLIVEVKYIFQYLPLKFPFFFCKDRVGWSRQDSP